MNLCHAPRACTAGYTYHVLNRGNARAAVFHKADDYDAFVEMMAEASLRTPMRILAYCLMPNHFHLCSGPGRTATSAAGCTG